MDENSSLTKEDVDDAISKCREQQDKYFSEHRKSVMTEISRLTTKIESLHGEIREIYQEVKDLRKDLAGSREEIAVLQVKAGIWGFIGAIIPALSLIILTYLIQKR